MLHVTVLAIALLGQTIYTWTDKDGEEHYTDDPTSIPKGVKAKTMAPGEVEMVQSSPEPTEVAPPKPTPLPTPDAGVPPKPKVNTCERAKKRVADAEANLAEARKLSATPPQRDCQAVLNTQGQGAYARCMAGRADEGDVAKFVAAAQRHLDDAKDELRRAQAAGCQ
jgi:type IV secretory pathway VirB10-like protein